MPSTITQWGLALLLSWALAACASVPQTKNLAQGNQKSTVEAERQAAQEQQIQRSIAYYSHPAVTHQKPEDAQISWQDYNAFWAAVDASRQSDGSFDEGIFYKTYRENKTGVLDAHSELFFEGDGEKLYQIYDLIPFYESWRDQMLKASDFPQKAYLAAQQKLKQFFPEAVFPNIYFYVGRMQQGGTAVPKGLLIACEIYQQGADPDYAKIPASKRKLADSARLILAKHSKKELNAVLVHELMHFVQISNSGEEFMQKVASRDFLTTVLIEGTADFLAYIVSGDGYAAGPGSEKDNYGKSKERELWQKFSADLEENNFAAWLYNAGKPEKGEAPADMGYWMGFQIARAYWDTVADKKQAFRQLLLWTDAQEILAQSGYAERHSAR